MKKVAYNAPVLTVVTVTHKIGVLLTGGEPLLHPDFSEIYLFAYELGFKVSIFTNGALVSKEICEMLQEYPPEVVEISLYGHSAETYDKFVGVDGAFGRFDENIDMLRQYDIKLILKFTLTTITVDLLGCLLSVVAHAANIHDTKGGISTAKRAYEQYPSIQKFCADAGYRGTFVSELKEQGTSKRFCKETAADDF